MFGICVQVLGQKGLKPYVPDFTKAFNHFCLHAGTHKVSFSLLQGSSPASTVQNVPHLPLLDLGCRCTVASTVVGDC